MGILPICIVGFLGWSFEVLSACLVCFLDSGTPDEKWWGRGGSAWRLCMPLQYQRVVSLQAPQYAHDLSHEKSVSTVSIDTVFFVGRCRDKLAAILGLEGHQETALLHDEYLRIFANIYE